MRHRPQERGLEHVRAPQRLGLDDLPLQRIALDRGAEDPVDLYVNGRAFARGRLTLVDEEWAVEIDEIFPSATTQTMHEGGSKPWHAYSS
jgi:hypothetical protein